MKHSSFADKLFETVHLLLIAALVFGAPIVGVLRPRGEPFSLVTALKNVGSLMGVVVFLGLLNFAGARMYYRLNRPRSEPPLSNPNRPPEP
jgi:hypothetical protein